MNKEGQAIDETTETVDTDTTDDLYVEQQSNDMETDHRSMTEPSDGDSASAEGKDDSQIMPEPGETATTELETSKSEPNPEYMNVLGSVDQHLSNLQELFTGQIARNQNQKQMFDTIYREMKDYKENSLMDAFHKPIIHNLIQFYDNFVSVESELNGINEIIDAFGVLFDDASAKQLKKLRPKELAEGMPQVWKKLKRKLTDFRNNMENVRIELEEVLYRIDVEPYDERLKKLDRKLHKTIKAIPTDDPDQHENVAEVRKIGFYWREKVFRPEEVTIFRHTPTVSEPEDALCEETVSENSKKEKGDETDG